MISAFKKPELFSIHSRHFDHLVAYMEYTLPVQDRKPERYGRFPLMYKNQIGLAL